MYWRSPGVADPNGSRLDPRAEGGFYESFFVRANHPRRPLALWIRYTATRVAAPSPRTFGELWAVWFDGEHGRHVAVREEVEPGALAFARDRLDVRLGSAVLRPGHCSGRARSGGHSIAWDLRYEGQQPPLLLLPPRRYQARFPHAKALVGVPAAVFRGHLEVDGELRDVDGWPGSQNHNWGRRHTDWYAWGQAVGFDQDPDAFLEVASARMRFGPWWSPTFTALVLRRSDGELRANTFVRTLLARARVGYFDWEFSTSAGGYHLAGRIWAEKRDFVGLRYRNPPGGIKYCLNTKLASCRLELTDPAGRSAVLDSHGRTGFEILSDDRPHGIPLSG